MLALTLLDGQKLLFGRLAWRESGLAEVGCGGGLLLRDALAGGAHATGIDHSEDMVELARERARAAA